MTFLEHLSEFNERRPFRPFIIRTDDGRGFPISKPSRVMIDDRGDRFAVFALEGGFTVLEASHIVALEEPALTPR